MATQTPLQLGMIGLGRMGANMAQRLLRDGHRIVGHNRAPEPVAALVANGGTGASSVEELVSLLEPPRAVWLMLPAGAITEGVLQGARGAARCRRHDRRRRKHALPRRHPSGAGARSGGIAYLDCGTSGGIFGLERGYCLMIGGDRAAFERLEPIFASLAPGHEAAPRSRSRTRPPTPEEHGYLHCGGSGAGHFVKMVHNGIEYGLMAAYAEGFNLLHHADAGLVGRDQDAETAPLAHPEHYTYDLDVSAIAELWRRGASSPPGCSISPRTRCTTRRGSRGSPAACRTPARVGGPRWPPSRRGLRRQCSRPRSTRASPRERKATSRIGFSRRCAPSSVGTQRSPRDR